jgi:DNA-binding response OmpR family regulator
MLKVGDVALNTKTRTLYCNGDTIALTRTEARLLESLMRQPGQVVSAKTLMKEVWPTWGRSTCISLPCAGKSGGAR